MSTIIGWFSFVALAAILAYCVGSWVSDIRRRNSHD